uniref:Transcriptional regulator CRZ1 n=1 Tax=Talaromyces marneffei PM1 TaxID=1077442 RepID=A0A093UVH8_TALMA
MASYGLDYSRLLILILSGRIKIFTQWPSEGGCFVIIAWRVNPVGKFGGDDLCTLTRVDCTRVMSYGFVWRFVISLNINHSDRIEICYITKYVIRLCTVRALVITPIVAGLTHYQSFLPILLPSPPLPVPSYALILLLQLIVSALVCASDLRFSLSQAGEAESSVHQLAPHSLQEHSNARPTRRYICNLLHPYCFNYLLVVLVLVLYSSVCCRHRDPPLCPQSAKLVAALSRLNSGREYKTDMTTSVITEARSDPRHLFPPGKLHGAFMAGQIQTSGDPVAISNPLPAATTAILSGPSDQISYLKNSPKPESHLSSIASAGLRTSPSPGFETSAPASTTIGMASSTTGQPPVAGKEQNAQHHDSPRVAREALNAAVDTRKEDAAPILLNEPADSSPKPAQVSADDMQVDSYTSSGHFAEPSTGADDQANQTLMNTSTVASPGPIEEIASQDGDRPRHQTDLADDATKAFSYPMPANSPLDPRRGLSLPHSGFHKGSPRSPSTKKHRCPYCSTEFTRHHNLKSHLLTHSQEKPRLHDLKRHTKLHTGERPHICDKCGRRFARGDALARHNKGQGGCAGRRSSMGSYAGEEDFGDGTVGAEDTMDGLMYTEPERMDEEEERCLGIPGIRKHNNVSSEPMPRAPGVFQNRAPSTYPPIASTQPPPPPPPPRGLFPPPTNHGGSSSSTSPISTSGTMTFPATAHSSTPTSFPAPNMTESPRPLSPNALSTQASHGADTTGTLSHQPHRSHSPSLSQQYQPSHFRHGQGSLGLPPPQLPPPPGLNAPDSRFLHSQGSVQNGPTSALTAKHSGTHNHSSSLGAPLASQANIDPTSSGGPESNVQGESREDKLWAYIRSVHEEVGTLRAEVASLRSQLAAQNQGASSAQSENTGPR